METTVLERQVWPQPLSVRSVKGGQGQENFPNSRLAKNGTEFQISFHPYLIPWA